MHYLYILFSSKSNRYYIGETHDLTRRLLKHNTHSYEAAFTKIADDWKIVLKFECQNKEQAVFLEKFIKKMKSRKFTEKIIHDPEILKNLLAEK